MDVSKFDDEVCYVMLLFLQILCLEYLSFCSISFCFTWVNVFSLTVVIYFVVFLYSSTVHVAQWNIEVKR